VNHQPQRILIVRTDRIGDVILTLPMAQALKRHFPGAVIGMFIQKYTAEIVEGNSSVDLILLYDDGTKPFSFLSLVATLRSHRFDAVFHTHPRFHLALMTWIAGIPVRIGTGYRWYSFLFNRKVFEHRKDARHHELEYNLHLLQVLDCPVENADVVPRLDIPDAVVDTIRQNLNHHGVKEGNKIIIIHPGSGGSARDWAATNFGRLAQQLSLIKNICVVVTGGKNEENLVSEVKSIGGPKVMSIVDKLSLVELAALAKVSSLFIANSTGPLHLAATVGARVIGLYPQITALSAERWGPYTSKKTIFTPIGKPVNCTKCLHGNRGCECMNSITVDQVYRAAVEYLADKPE
jgi:heptosyltransferase-3